LAENKASQFDTKDIEGKETLLTRTNVKSSAPIA